MCAVWAFDSTVGLDQVTYGFKSWVDKPRLLVVDAGVLHSEIKLASQSRWEKPPGVADTWSVITVVTCHVVTQHYGSVVSPPGRRVERNGVAYYRLLIRTVTSRG